MRLVKLLVIVLLAAWASPAAGQSLAAVAKKEEARRKQIKTSSKVITNKDLRQVDPGTPLVTPAPAVTTPPVATPAPDAAAPGDKPVDEDEQRKQDETAWRQKMADARVALERSQMYADALQSKINALWADFTARDDPAQRAQLELERKRALAEQERVKGEIETQKKAIADLEEEARKAGVPPGWIR
jgi:hypothetical protein